MILAEGMNNLVIPSVTISSGALAVMIMTLIKRNGKYVSKEFCGERSANIERRLESIEKKLDKVLENKP